MLDNTGTVSEEPTAAGAERAAAALCGGARGCRAGKTGAEKAAAEREVSSRREDAGLPGAAPLQGCELPGGTTRTACPGGTLRLGPRAEAA